MKKAKSARWKTAGKVLDEVAKKRGDRDTAAKSAEAFRAAFRAATLGLVAAPAPDEPPVKRILAGAWFSQTKSIPGYEQYTSATGPCILLDGGTIIAANVKWTSKWGWTESEAVGGNIITLLHGPDTSGPNFDDLHRARAMRKPITVLITYYTKSGTAIEQSISSTPVGDTHFVQTCQPRVNLFWDRHVRTRPAAQAV